MQTRFKALKKPSLRFRIYLYVLYFCLLSYLIKYRLAKIQKYCFILGTPAQTGTGTLIVNLMDVNDNFPEFAHDYRPVVYENQPHGLTVAHVSAVDRDTVSNGPPFEFWLPCGGGCPCQANPTCNDFAFKFIPGECLPCWKFQGRKP